MRFSVSGIPDTAEHRRKAERKKKKTVTKSILGDERVYSASEVRRLQSSRCSCIEALSSRLMSLFGKVMEVLVSVTFLKIVCHLGWITEGIKHNSKNFEGI